MASKKNQSNKKGIAEKLKWSKWDTRLSFLVMGSAHFVKKQFVNGFFYLFTQVLFLLYMARRGAAAVAGLITLGTSTQGWVYDESRGINVLVKGDNSMIMLLNGVMALFMTLLFILLYIKNIQAAFRLQRLAEEKKPIPTFMEQFRDLFDGKFHVALLSLPSLGVLAFTVLPLIFMILIAFTNFDTNHQPPGNLFSWVGFDNFKSLLVTNPKQSQTFFPVLQWTFIWAIFATLSCYIFGSLVAILINRKGIKLKKLWRTILVTTIAVPQFISLLVMKNMLNDYGMVNELLLKWGLISERIHFLTNPTMARITVLCVNLWVGVPYIMLLVTGILLNIPEEQYEAAKIDGATPISAFFYITLPHLLFVMAPNLITSFIGNINNFSVIYLLTEGGPQATNYYQAGKTDLMVTWLYKLTVERRDYNLASTIGIIVFIISVVISLTMYRLTPSYRKEDDFA